MFDDPLLRRELSGMARRWTTFAVRTLVGVGMALVVFYFWDVVQGYDRYRRLSYGLSELADIARQAFLLYFSGLMVGLPVAATTTAADLIPKEVRGGTLGLLFLTPLTPWRIVVGKWKAAMAQVGLLLLAGGPLAAVCAYLNGIEAWDLLWGTALPLASAAFATSLTLLVSTFLRTSALTVVAAVLLLLAGWAVPGWIVASGANSPADFELLGRLHPAFMAMFLVEPRSISTDLLRYGWISASGVSLLASWILLRLAAARLPGRLAVTPGPSFFARLMGRLDRFFDEINVGGRRFFVRSGDVWDERALLWKELRLRVTGRLRHATRVAVALLVLGLLPFLGSDDDLFKWISVFVWAFPALLVLQAVVFGAALFSQEREGRQWDVLLSTPLTVPEILHAKLAGGLIALAPTAAAGLVYVFLISTVHHDGIHLLMGAVLPTAAFALFSLVAASAVSLRAKSYRGAFAGAMGIVLGVLVGLPLAWAVLRTAGFWHLREREFLGSTNVIWYLDQASSSLRYASFSSMNLDLDGLPLYLLLHVAATAGMLVWMRRRFDRLAGRA